MTERDITGLGIHRLHNRQRVDIVSFLTQSVPATLESLFHGDADAFHRGAGMLADIDQAAQRLAVGQEIVDEQDMILRPQITSSTR